MAGLSPGAAAADEPLKLAIPDLTGNAKVGTRSFPLVDRSRPAGFDQTGPRRLMVQVTYPRRPGRCQGASYLPDGTAERLLSYLALEGQKVEIRTGTCAGGPVVRRKLPLVVFSHAYTADRAVYTSLVADLASRGFIVASIDHTSDAFAVEFPSGRVVDGVYGSPLSSKPIDEAELVKLVNVRTRDVRFVTTWLLKQNRLRRSWLGGRIDPKRIGVFGHSLGGATAARVATVDRRFRASADVDGSLFGEWPLTTKSRKPFLLFVSEGGLGSVLPQDKSCPYFGAAAQPKLAWQLTGSQHLSFSDFQTLAPQIAAAKPDWPFASLYPIIIGNLDPAASIASQRGAIARFFRAYLRPPNARPKRVRPPAPPAGVTPVSAESLTCATATG
ncbi:MAG: hypothetical protein J0H98_03755 [Solirubrobacterales bacterium]|nr:hypothetical protein [Solirubrobacterales bacterium]